MQGELRYQYGRSRSGARVLASILAVATGVILTAQQSAGQWSTVGGDSANSRYSSLAQINSQNVTKLGAAWVSEKVGPPPSARAMPVVDDGLLFLTAPPFVTAVNISTGQIAWQYRLAPDTVPGAPACGLPRARGRGGGRRPRFRGVVGFQSHRAP